MPSSEHTDVPQPAPEVIMDANGAYWRRYDGALSMCPVSDDNDATRYPLYVYELRGLEDDERRFSTDRLRDLRLAEQDRDHYRDRLAGLLNYARGNQYVLDEIHSALDHPPSKVGP